MSLAPGTGEPIRILHVEDDQSFSDLLEAYLEKIEPSLTVVAVEDAESALEFLRTNSVDCIVSDYDMPGMNGIELLTAVRDQEADVPFILLTGKGSEEIASDAITAGVSDYLQKSGGTEQYELLANRIRRATEKHRMERHIRQVYEAIDVIDEGLSLLDTGGWFIYVNEAYARTFGYEPAELVGEHWGRLYRNDADVAYMRDEVLAKMDHEKPWKGVTCQARKDGSKILIDHTLAYTSEDLLACLAVGLDRAPPPTDVPVVDSEAVRE